MSALTFFFAGRDYDVAVFLQSSISLVVTSICLYSIGTRLLDRTAALVAVVIYNTVPAVALWSRYYTLDLPLTAFVTATVWLIVVYAQAGADRRHRLAAALGVMITFGMWAKHAYPVYVFLPIAGLLFFLFSESRWLVTRFLREQGLLLITLTLAIGFGLSYHVVFNFKSFYDGVLRSFLIGGNALTQSGYTPPTLRERAVGFYNFILSGSSAALIVIAVGAVAALLRRSRHLIFVWLWLAGSLGFFFFILGPTLPYYFHAVIPAIALIAAAWVTSSRARHPTIRRGVLVLQTGAAVFLAAFLIGHYLNISLGTFSPLAVARHAPALFGTRAPIETNPLSSREYWRATYVNGNIDTLPYPHIWPIDPILNTLRTAVETRLSDHKYTIGLGTNYEWLNGYAFNYRMKHLGIYDNFSLSVPIPPPPASSAETLMNDYDFLVHKTGPILKLDYRGIKWADQAQDFYDHLTGDGYAALRKAGWRSIGMWPLPDRSEASVWVSPALSEPHAWPIDPILSALATAVEERLPGSKHKVGLGTNFEWFNHDLFVARMKALGIYDDFSLSAPLPPPSSLEALLTDLHFVIIKTGSVLNRYYRGAKWADDAQAFYDRLAGDGYAALRNAGWRLIGKWPLPDRSEASLWASPILSVIRLPRRLETAVRSILDPGYIAPWSGKIGGSARPGIFMHPRPDEPISALTWRKLKIPEDATELAFGIAFDPSVCDKPVSPVRYEINIAADGRTDPVFNHVLEATSCDQLRWEDFRVSVAPWRGKTIDLTLSTRPVHPPDVLYSHAVWSNLEIR